MSAITAHTILPLFLALNDQEKEKFAVMALLKKYSNVPEKVTKEVYEDIPEIFHPDNQETMVSLIMSGNF